MSLGKMDRLFRYFIPFPNLLIWVSKDYHYVLFLFLLFDNFMKKVRYKYKYLIQIMVK